MNRIRLTERNAEFRRNANPLPCPPEIYVDRSDPDPDEGLDLEEVVDDLYRYMDRYMDVDAISYGDIRSPF